MPKNIITIDLDDETKDLLRAVVVGLEALAAGVLTVAVADDDDDDDDGDGDEKVDEKAADKKAKAAAKKEKAAKKADKEDDGPTREEVRDALKAHASLEGKDAAITILNDVGEAASISELDEDKFQAVIDATNE